MYMMVAEALAENNTGLDTAKKYIIAAETWAREKKRPELANILHVKAEIHSKNGNYTEAEELEREALQNEPTNADFLYKLGIYQESYGRTYEALRSLARSILFGNSTKALQEFDSLVTRGKTESETQLMKESIVNEIVRAYVDTTKPENIIEARSTAAALMARTGVNLTKAREWAASAAKSPEKGESIETYITYQQNLALVSCAENKFTEAAVILGAVADLVDPWNEEFWYVLGQAYEKTGKKEQAKDSYLNALIGGKTQRLMNAYTTLTVDGERSTAQIDSAIENKRQTLTDFQPGHVTSKKSKTDKVVLAELFTGSECGPCQAADRAFDYLSEYYPRKTLVILENHLHIPQPDPMTNSDSWDRYMSYGGNFGTPTVIIDGTHKVVGGGPMYLGKNRFTVYDHFIKRAMSETPPVIIEGNATLTDGRIAVDIQIKPSKQIHLTALSVRLHIALVEKSIDYTGGNGISRHTFVVRKVIDGGRGMALKVSDSGSTITRRIKLSEVEQGIRSYLDTVSRHPSWRPSFEYFQGWKTRPDTIDPSNIAIVAWIQDPESKEVLQAFFCDVKAFRQNTLTQ
jgi:tetratricopeptide (TPR) repeat protein